MLQDKSYMRGGGGDGLRKGIRAVSGKEERAEAGKCLLSKCGLGYRISGPWEGVYTLYYSSSPPVWENEGSPGPGNQGEE